MIPVDFPGSNILMQKPKEMTDEQCMPLPAFKGMDGEFPCFIECWQPSKEDIEAINQGRPIYLKILSLMLPPIAVWTLDEKGDANI